MATLFYFGIIVFFYRLNGYYLPSYFDYKDLFDHLGKNTLKLRSFISSVIFMYKIIYGKVDWAELLSLIDFYVHT